MSPTEVFSYLSRVMYNRRNKFDPLWNSIVVGGVEKVRREGRLACQGTLHGLCVSGGDPLGIAIALL